MTMTRTQGPLTIASFGPRLVPGFAVFAPPGDTEQVGFEAFNAACGN